MAAAALATRSSRTAFLIGMATSVGAGISMAFAEALSDDGRISGRGNPWKRGMICGVMTFAGGAGHTLPFLIQNFRLAMALAMSIVAVELVVIAWIRHRYMRTPIGTAMLQIVVGGAIVFLSGILIGSS